MAVFKVFLPPKIGAPVREAELLAVNIRHGDKDTVSSMAQVSQIIVPLIAADPWLLAECVDWSSTNRWSLAYREVLYCEGHGVGKKFAVFAKGNELVHDINNLAIQFRFGDLAALQQALPANHAINAAEFRAITSAVGYELALVHLRRHTAAQRFSRLHALLTNANDPNFNLAQWPRARLVADYLCHVERLHVALLSAPYANRLADLILCHAFFSTYRLVQSSHSHDKLLCTSLNKIINLIQDANNDPQFLYSFDDPLMFATLALPEGLRFMAKGHVPPGVTPSMQVALGPILLAHIGGVMRNINSPYGPIPLINFVAHAHPIQYTHTQ